MNNSIVGAKYNKIIQEISSIYEQARKTLVRSYWEIGKYIIEVEQDGNIRAQYGTKLLENLSKDLSLKYGKGFSLKNIYRMRDFYSANKKLSAPTKLEWTHYVELLSVEDHQKRKELEREATRKNLTTDELRKRIKQSEKIDPVRAIHESPLRKPINLELNTYRLANHPQMDSSRDKIIDCGFYVYKPTSSSHLKIMDQPAYTYKAKVERVIDGDTLWVVIDIGFQITVREKLRLRGIDTPELGTPEGEAAKKYVSQVLKPGQEIIIKTSKSDLYGRFLADVFYSTLPLRARDIITKGKYLNQELLEMKLAKRMM